ncbi:hypothetical protein [Roseovarius sp.]|uniref:hypothetical protein n=1 Tax=Roseovarius sp. TaxID=1486281 RepID=UPI00356228B9
MTSWGARQDSIVFRIDRETPLSLERLTFGMMALGAEYERFVRKEHPKAADHEADLLVQRVTEGSIVIELIGAMQPLFQGMNNAVVFGQFVDLIGAKIGTLTAPRGRLKDPTVGELENLTRMAETVVGDSKGEAEVFAMEYQSETNERQVQAKVVWKAKEAEKVIENATSQLREIRDGDANKHNGLLMRLFQTNISEAVPDRSSGEKGIIEALDPKPRKLIYASDLAGQKIKGAWSDEKLNPYELGFVVDVDVQTVNGKPRAYRILEVHDIFPLDEED